MWTMWTIRRIAGFSSFNFVSDNELSLLSSNCGGPIDRLRRFKWTSLQALLVFCCCKPAIASLRRGIKQAALRSWYWWSCKCQAGRQAGLQLTRSAGVVSGSAMAWRRCMRRGATSAACGHDHVLSAFASYSGVFSLCSTSVDCCWSALPGDVVCAWPWPFRCRDLLGRFALGTLSSLRLPWWRRRIPVRALRRNRPHKLEEEVKSQSLLRSSHWAVMVYLQDITSVLPAVGT